ncbi:MAG: hypothetical protein KDA84_23670, partial [Planctomycetaceae bacterium]|nr:hypothetical protein [Planctomycetaceae bacterium]
MYYFVNFSIFPVDQYGRVNHDSWWVSVSPKGIRNRIDRLAIHNRRSTSTPAPKCKKVDPHERIDLPSTATLLPTTGFFGKNKGIFAPGFAWVKRQFWDGSALTERIQTKTMKIVATAEKPSYDQLDCHNGGRCSAALAAHKRNDDFVITHTSKDFIEAGMTDQRSIVVLRQELPMEKNEVRRCALVFGGIQNTRAFGEVRTIAYDPSASKSTALSLREH